MGREMQRPNIIVVMTDQQRRDSLGFYGNEFCRSPNLDALADESIVFDHGYTPYPLCTPARASMWTGVMPHMHGVIQNIYGEADAFASRSKIKRTVFHDLHDGGYLTGYIGKWHLGEARPEGAFDVWDSFNSQGGHWIQGVQSFQGGVYRPDRDTDVALDVLKRFASEEKPFALVLGYYPPHEPYTAPERWTAYYRQRGVPFPGYYAHVSALDACVGRLVAGVRALGLWDETALFFVADHGETFLYRDGLSSKRVCHDEAIRVPFVVKPPRSTYLGPARSQAFVSLIDLVPTMLSLAGVPVPSTVQGLDLGSILAGGGDTTWQRSSIYIENDHLKHVRILEDELPVRREVFGPWPQRAIRTRDWKLILSEGGKNSLYDLRYDPEEELDVFLTPREDRQQQFTHFRSHQSEVVALAEQLQTTASAYDDELGVRLAQKILKHPSSGGRYGEGQRF